MIFGIILLVTALFISTVAAGYSIIGLMAIFSGAAVAIAVMGAALEVGKIVAALWLHRNWQNFKSHRLVMVYLSFAVGMLMIITSMGIYGFLSKAHVESTARAGDVTADIEFVEQKIKSLQVEISQQEKIRDQLDRAIDEYIDMGYVTRGLRERESQAESRLLIDENIRQLNTRIDVLQKERFDIESVSRDLALDVGPARYIAELVYGTNDESAIENAVRIVIIALIFVFDPLAILLLIASQITFAANRKEANRGDITATWNPADDESGTPEQRRARKKKNRMGFTKDQM